MIERLLFVVDAAVADVAELPTEVRAVLDAAAELYVLTPTLPGRLAWLADDVDRCRHVADERLDIVVQHMDDIGADVSRAEAIRGSLVTVIGDAVARFAPDHILLALRSPEHANWQEKGLVEHMEEHFNVPVISYTVDEAGHTVPADGPLLLCFDGSTDAAHAIERAGVLFPGRHALVLTVWQPTVQLGSFAWAGATASMSSFFGEDRAAADVGGRISEEGVRLAQAAGLVAEPIVIEAAGSVWDTIVTVAGVHNASTIVMGSRGLTGLRSMLLGSVSSAVVQHADRPTMVIRQPAKT